jgi:hypothetical protein
MIGLSAEVREWLRALRTQDLAVARSVGEAVTVLLGDPRPAVRSLEEALRAEHPVLALDFSYISQLEFLQPGRRHVADLATERRRLEVLGQSHPELRKKEIEATLAIQRQHSRVEEFRNRKETAKAVYRVARAKQEINEELDSFEEGQDDEVAAAKAAIDELLRTADEMQHPHSRGFSELKVDALDLRLLFSEPSDGFLMLLVVGMGMDNWGDWYDEAVPLAAEESTAASEHLAWYGLGAFLSEFFAGEEAVIRAAAEKLGSAPRSRV